MQAYIGKRLLLFIPTFILVTGLVFIVLRLVPGDPAIMLLGGSEGEEEYTQEALAAKQAELGTDRPIAVQYGKWIWNMLHLDFGTSYFSNKPVYQRVSKKFPVTLELTVIAMLLGSAAAVPLGVISAIKQDTLADYAGRIITIAGIALPNFWIAIMIIFLLVLWFDWLPPRGYVNLWDDPVTNLQQVIFPAIALGFSNMAFIGRVTRSSMLEVLREDYIRTARSKGLREQVVVFRHALRNALMPVATVAGYDLGRLIGGTVIIEVIFSVPGLGRLLIDAVLRRDFPMIQSIIVLIIVFVLVLNMILDLLYAWLNPRIRYT